MYKLQDEIAAMRAKRAGRVAAAAKPKAARRPVAKRPVARRPAAKKAAACPAGSFPKLIRDRMAGAMADATASDAMDGAKTSWNRAISIAARNGLLEGGFQSLSCDSAASKRVHKINRALKDGASCEAVSGRGRARAAPVSSSDSGDFDDSDSDSDSDGDLPADVAAARRRIAARRAAGKGFTPAFYTGATPAKVSNAQLRLWAKKQRGEDGTHAPLAVRTSRGGRMGLPGFDSDSDDSESESDSDGDDDDSDDSDSGDDDSSDDDSSDDDSDDDDSDDDDSDDDIADLIDFGDAGAGAGAGAGKSAGAVIESEIRNMLTARPKGHYNLLVLEFFEFIGSHGGLTADEQLTELRRMQAAYKR